MEAVFEKVILLTLIWPNFEKTFDRSLAMCEAHAHASEKRKHACAGCEHVRCERLWCVNVEMQSLSHIAHMYLTKQAKRVVAFVWAFTASNPLFSVISLG